MIFDTEIILGGREVSVGQELNYSGNTEGPALLKVGGCIIAEGIVEKGVKGYSFKIIRVMENYEPV